MKMYILILEDVPDEFAPVIASHASLACYLKFKDDPRMIEWLDKSFKKVVCRASYSEYNKAKEAGDFVELGESRLDKQIVASVFCPRPEWPKGFIYLKKWAPNLSKMNIKI